MSPKGVNTGASAAIFGMFGCLLVELVFSWSSIAHPKRHVRTFVLVMVLALFLGLLPAVDNWGHLGKSLFMSCFY
jgi:membrane associated rhomboid family serine protease